MNPESFSPTEAYRTRVETSLESIFESVPFKHFSSGATFRSRIWRDGQIIYGAYEERIPRIVKLFGAIPIRFGYHEPIVTVERFALVSPDLLEDRVYRYHDHQLKVAKQMRDLDYLRGYEDYEHILQRFKYIEDMFATSTEPTADTEYLEFIDDLDSFSPERTM